MFVEICLTSRGSVSLQFIFANQLVHTKHVYLMSLSYREKFFIQEIINISWFYNIIMWFNNNY